MKFFSNDDKSNAYLPQQKIKVSSQLEDASVDYIPPQSPNHGTRHAGTRNTERREPPTSQSALPAGASDSKIMALMRRDQEERPCDDEITDQQERQQEVHNSATRNRQDEESHNTEQFSSYSTGEVNSSHHQYEQSPSSINLADFEVQKEERQTVVVVPTTPAALDGNPQAKTKEERPKRKTYLLLGLTIVVVALIVVVAVVTTVGMKGSDDESSPSSDASESSDDQASEPPTTHKPTTLPPTTSEPTTQPPTSPAAWEEYGSNINGENAFDFFGYLTALSGDGSTIAGAATWNDGYAGSVRVFRIKGNSWTQIGQRLGGIPDESDSGMTLATSYDGSTIAIGGQYYGWPNLKGRVRVFEYNSVTDWWSLLGDPIYGLADDDFFGSSVSLSGNGRMLAVGASGANDNGEDSGHVRVFEYGAGTEGWYQVGQTISGENSSDFAGDHVKLTYDGKTVAMASRFNDGEGSHAGHVRMFRYDRAANEWTQMGQDIEKVNTGNNIFGLSVDLSRDGTMIAIGAPGYQKDGKENCGLVQVYEYDVGDEKWYQMFGLVGVEGDECGRSVSLSGDGTKVAFGCDQYNVNKEGELLIYQYDDDLNDWVNTLHVAGENKMDTFGMSVSLSDDGSVVAVGGPGNGENGVFSGHIRVFILQ